MNIFYAALRKFSIFTFLALVSATGFAQTTYVVDNITDVDDGGNTNTAPISLRKAIRLANTDAAADVINFGVPGIIVLTSNLPAITQPLTINGYSAPTAVAGTIAARTIAIELMGANIATTGLTISSNDVTINGLSIYGCTSYGISISGGIDNVSVWGSFIGVTAAGVSVRNGAAGIFISETGFGTPVDASNNIVIGTDGNGVNDAQEGNLISANGSGAFTDGGIIAFFTTGSRFSGNVIGLDRTGAVSASNTYYNYGSGILLSDRSTGNIIGTNGDGTSDNEERNYISNNGANGIWIFSKSDFNVVANNVVGLEASGALAANVNDGIFIDNSSNCNIGTSTTGAVLSNSGNFISSRGNGIHLRGGGIGSGFDEDASNNLIAGNAIGVGLDRTAPLGNGSYGVLLENANGFLLANNIIGSNGDGVNDATEGNIIANSTLDGIQLSPSATISNTRISMNSIYNNAGIGIDLVNGAEETATGGVTPNDNGDADAGPNGLLNAPVITSAAVNASSELVISGFSTPGSIVEFYLADAGPNPNPLPAGFTKSFGEGQTYLFSALEGGTLNGIADEDATTGTYTGADEGTGGAYTNTENRFTFTIPLGTAGLSTGTFGITALALQAGTGAVNTSEFGGTFLTVITPIQLVDFTARKTGERVFLKWSTSSESNNAYFIIERSIDGSPYQEVGKVAGSGTTSSVKNYSFEDVPPVAKLYRYRLRQTDKDGRSNYSKDVLIRSDVLAGSAKVYPVPFNNNLNVSYSVEKAGKVEIRLYDQLGRVAYNFSSTANAGTNSVNLTDISKLPKGNYTIQIAGENISFKQKIIKE